jgi:serpin B
MLTLLPFLSLTFTPAASGPAPEVRAVALANNQFAFDLYGQLGRREGNLFFSPYSVTKALAMTYAGARGDTAKEMEAVLHFTLDPARQHWAFREMRRLLNGHGSLLGAANPLAGKPNVQLYLSANLWGQRGYGFQRDFTNLLEECYGAGLQEVDFTASEQARRTINAWVQRQTHDKIKELFPQGMIDSSTRLVLASAIYFKGDWAHRFQRIDTHDDSFQVNGSRMVPVKMMTQTEAFGYFEDDQLQALQMPYKGDDLAMVVLLPRKPHGLADLERALTGEKLAAWTSQLQEQEVAVSLPKFRLSEGFSLTAALQALGLKRAFAAGADFSGMNDGREPLQISEVVHKAFADVNEEGTEAAAVTGEIVTLGAVRHKPPIPVFRADHPFVFAIREVRTGVVLFLGRVARP